MDLARLKIITYRTAPYKQLVQLLYDPTKINVPNINVLQINGSLHQQKLVEV